MLLRLREDLQHGTEQIAISGPAPTSPTTPFAAILPGETTIFLVTAPPRSERTLQTVSKISWRNKWNGPQLQPEEIASDLIASAAAPGLGLHPRHLPAPIYRANEIAGSNDQDLRFRGKPVRRLLH